MAGNSNNGAHEGRHSQIVEHFGKAFALFLVEFKHQCPRSEGCS